MRQMELPYADISTPDIVNGLRDKEC